MRIKKTSETRPLASHTVNAYSESESNAYSCDYSNKAFGGVVLYNNTSGSNETITLNDSAANYEYIEVFFRSNDNVYASIKASNGQRVMLQVVTTVLNNDYRYNINLCNATISGTSITPNTYFAYNIKAGWERTDAQQINNVYITKVIGYKTGLFPTQQSTRSVNTYSGDIEEKKNIVIDDGGEEPIDDGNKK